LQRHARAFGFKNIQLNLLPVEIKTVGEELEEKEENVATKTIDNNAELIVDVRTVSEFRSGAYPDAVNIPLDDLMHRSSEFGENMNREIVVYCASGGRSAYAQRMLMQLGYTHVTNGGGLSSMMANLNKKSAPTQTNEPLIVDVRTPGEFAGGAYEGAINIQLDELPARVNELGDKSRDITLYCASGARSAYGQRILQQLGFSNVKNGGGLMHMMMRK